MMSGDNSQVDEFVDSLKSTVAGIMETDKEVLPVIIIPREDGIYALPAAQFQDKDIMFSAISQIRTMVPLLAFVTEAWRVEVKGPIDCAPVDHPDRIEIVSVVIYHGIHVSMWSAEILRSGNWVGLGEWKRDENMTGRMTAVPPSWN